MNSNILTAQKGVVSNTNLAMFVNCLKQLVIIKFAAIQ